MHLHTSRLGSCIAVLLDGNRTFRPSTPLQGKRKWVCSCTPDVMAGPFPLRSLARSLPHLSSAAFPLTLAPPCRSTVEEDEEDVIAVFYPRLQGAFCNLSGEAGRGGARRIRHGCVVFLGDCLSLSGGQCDGSMGVEFMVNGHAMATWVWDRLSTGMLIFDLGRR